MTSEKAISSIKQELFSLKMESKKTIRMSKLRKIVSYLLDVDRFYLLAQKGTTIEQWESGDFLPDTSDKVMIVFLDENDIQVYAKDHGYVSGGETALYGAVQAEALIGITGMFAQQGQIDRIRVYPRMPLVIDIPCELMEVELPDKAETSNPEEQPSAVLAEKPAAEPASIPTTPPEPVPSIPEQTAVVPEPVPEPTSTGFSAVAELPDLMGGNTAQTAQVLHREHTPVSPPIESELAPLEQEEANLAMEGHVFADQPQDMTVAALVNEIKKCLDMSENRLRKQVDPGLVYNNVHSMMGKLLFANPKMDIYRLENFLRLPGGFLTLYVKDKVSSSISKEKLVALLDYYGLAAYAYQYKKYCNDLRIELRDSPDIDTCEIRPASIHTKETFELLEVSRGKTMEGFYVYGLRFQSTFRIVDLIVSTPLGYVIGKHYELFDLPPLSDSSQAIPESRSATEQPNFHRERTVEEVLMDSVIAFFKRGDGLTVKAAKERYAALVRHPDIQMEFAKYTQTGKPGKIKVREYSANYLIRTLGFPPYDAYIKLCELRDEPDKTLQFLKYRERDPQYRRKKKQDS